MNQPRGNFASDNVAPISPEILEAIALANRGSVPAYGADALTERLTGIARALFETDLAIFPIATGTAANALALSCLAPPHGAVYCHEDAHITSSEAGAPEFLSGGMKVIGLSSQDSKLTPELLAEPVRRALAHGVHQSRPAAISISQATEWGTIYRPAEIAALAGFGRGQGMALHMDGARFANAVAALGCSPAEITWRQGVAALSLGATKNGALAAEAVVFFDRKLAGDFAYRRKRAGHLWSKMRFLSVQLIAYLEDGLWLRNAARANRMAARLAAGLAALPGFSMAVPVEANQLFVAMPDAAIDRLAAQGFAVRRWFPPPGLSGPVVRLVVPFDTDDAMVDEFVRAAAAAVS